MAEALFITPEDLKRNTSLSGSIDEDKFMQYILIAQEIHLQNYLGTNLYNRLQEGITASDLNANEVILLSDYVQNCLIHFANATYLPFAPWQVANGGVFKHTSENSVAADQSDIDYLVAAEKGLAEYYAQRLVDYLCDNSDLYPEYITNEFPDIKPDKKVQNIGGWRIN
jgi:hypothetical protein